MKPHITSRCNCTISQITKQLHNKLTSNNLICINRRYYTSHNPNTNNTTNKLDKDELLNRLLKEEIISYGQANSHYLRSSSFLFRSMLIKKEREIYDITKANLIKIAKKYNLSSLSAPQIEVNKYIFIITKDLLTDNDSKDSNIDQTKDKETDNEDKQIEEYHEFINPKIHYFSKDTNTDIENCSCFSCLSARIKRSDKIIISYINNKRQTIYQYISNNKISRLIQHHYNHLHGVLILNLSLNKGEIVCSEDSFNIVNDYIDFYKQRVKDYNEKLDLLLFDKDTKYYKKKTEKRLFKITPINEILRNNKDFDEFILSNKIDLNDYCANQSDFILDDQVVNYDYDDMVFPFEKNMLIDFEKGLKKEYKNLL